MKKKAKIRRQNGTRDQDSGFRVQKLHLTNLRNLWLKRDEAFGDRLWAIGRLFVRFVSFVDQIFNAEVQSKQGSWLKAICTGSLR